MVVLEVVTVNIAVPGALLLIATGDVLKEQVGSGAVPVTVHERLTLPVYPFSGVTVTVEVAPFPAATVFGLKAVAASV